MNELTHCVVILTAIATGVADPKSPLVLNELKALLVTLHERVELQAAYQSTDVGAAARARFEDRYIPAPPAGGAPAAADPDFVNPD